MNALTASCWLRLMIIYERGVLCPPQSLAAHQSSDKNEGCFVCGAPSSFSTDIKKKIWRDRLEAKRRSH